MGKKGVKHVQSTPNEVDGIKFASKFESEMYLQLKDRQSQGEITELKCHPPYRLQNKHVAVRELRGDKVRTYTPDFTYVENGSVIAVDTKGRLMDSLRLSVFKALYPNIELLVVKQGKRKKRKKVK